MNTMLVTDSCCSFCQTKTLEHVYTPINSARGMEVYVCKTCGLVQSISTKSYKSRPPGSMSADADRSSYRYTKDVIVNRYESCFTQFVDFNSITNVLDIGSNRGAFIRYLDDRYPGKNIVGIEPDPSVIDSYKSMTNVHIFNSRFENTVLPDAFFDFAYCAHTLEHASSAREMLHGVRNSLKDGGLFFVAVPSLIFYQDVIEELFIDPHTFHFDFKLLCDFVVQMGFSIEYAGKPNDPEIVLLLKKVSCSLPQNHKFFPVDKSKSSSIKKELILYSHNIISNRESLRASALKLSEAVDRFTVVIWGCGRILDALVKHGNLDISSVDFLVDKYLYKYVDSQHGMPLLSPDALKKEPPNNLLVYVASRNYSDEIISEAKTMGINNFICFGK